MSRNMMSLEALAQLVKAIVTLNLCTFKRIVKYPPVSAVSSISISQSDCLGPATTCLNLAQ